MIIYIMSMIILNALTGSILFIFFQCLEKWLEKIGMIKTNVWMLRFVILSFLIPVVFILLMTGYDDNVIFAPDDPLSYFFIGLLMIWMIGWIKALIHSIQIHKQLTYLIHTACMCEKEVIAIEEEWKKKLKIRSHIKVKYSYTIETPLICKIWNPVILLPARDYTREELNVIFVHELTHCKHKDILWKQLCAVGRIIFWWNPLMKRLIYDVDSWNESYCDYEVTKVLKNKKEYFTTVCRLGIEPFHKGAYLCAALYEDKNQLKTRIYRIKALQNVRKKGFTEIVVTLMLIFVSFSAVTFITKGYHRIYMSTIMMFGDLQGDVNPEENGVKVTDRTMNLKEYDNIRLNKKLPIVKMKEKIERGRDSSFLQTLKAKNRTESNWIYLKKGDVVKFDYMNSQDENPNKKDTDFITGIMDAHGNERYVMAPDQIIHDFKIEKAGNYKIFIENRYDSKTDVAIDFIWEKLE